MKAKNKFFNNYSPKILYTITLINIYLLNLNLLRSITR